MSDTTETRVAAEAARPPSAEKPKVGFYWCASCGGCEEAVVDLAEAVLDVTAAVDIVFWPVALDFKRRDVEAMVDRELLAVFINGAVRTTEQAEMVEMLRRKAKVVVAFGACSHLGGIPGLANLWDRASVFRTVYHDSPSTVNPDGVSPETRFHDNGREVTLPGFFDTVRTLDQVIPVDYYLPGCAPPPKLIAQAVETLLSGDLPPVGTVLAPDRALCSECSRKESRPEDLAITEFRRPHEVLIEEDRCLLAQGIPCMGPATRAGCEALCIEGNMPCTGCCGPTGRVRDQGAKIISAIASSAAGDEDEDIVARLSRMPDLIGTFYRYGLPASRLRRRKMETEAP